MNWKEPNTRHSAAAEPEPDGPIPRSIPVTGADQFLLGIDQETRVFHDGGHLSQMVLRIGPGFDSSGFQGTIDRLFQRIPILSASIRRKWGDWFGRPEYRFTHPPRTTPVYLHVNDNRPTAEQLLNGELISRGPGPLVRFDLLKEEEYTELVITWLCVLFDGVGIGQFVRFIAEVYSGQIQPDQIDWEVESKSPVSLPSLPKRLQLLNRWSTNMKDRSDPPPRSLAGPVTEMPKRIRYSVSKLSEERTDLCKQLVIEEAGFMRPMVFYLALSLRAHHRVFRMRGERPESYLVPVPVNLRNPGADRPMFRNNVSFLWFQVDPTDLYPRAELVRELKQQRLSQIRSNGPARTAIALDTLSYLPHWINRYMMRFQTEGELGSFFFSYTGTVLPEVSEFAGGDLLDAYPAPSVPPSPGSSLIWSEINGRLQVTHLYQDGVVARDERREMMEFVRADLDSQGDEKTL